LHVSIYLYDTIKNFWCQYYIFDYMETIGKYEDEFRRKKSWKEYLHQFSIY